MAQVRLPTAVEQNSYAEFFKDGPLSYSEIQSTLIKFNLIELQREFCSIQLCMN